MLAERLHAGAAAEAVEPRRHQLERGSLSAAGTSGQRRAPARSGQRGRAVAASAAAAAAASGGVWQRMPAPRCVGAKPFESSSLTQSLRLPPCAAGGENAGDAFYRYKMPKLQARVRAGGGGCGASAACRLCAPHLSELLTDDVVVCCAVYRGVQIEGRGNGIKTNVVNNADIAKSLERPPDCE